jgi:arsenite-transporting ATPase
VLSTDPAHSLGDALGVRLTARPARVPTRAGRLDALELDAARAVDRWLARRRPELSQAIEGGTLLDREDVERLLELPLPGVDELAGFLALAAVERAGRYDRVVVDTAPTGHTQRLLGVPEVAGRLAALFEAMFARQAAVASALGGRLPPNALVEELRRDGEAVSARLRDAGRTAMLWVTQPEPLAVRETAAAIEWLRRERFPLTTLVVNGVTAGRQASCAECRARVAAERAAVAPLAGISRDLTLRVVTRQPREPRGLARLRLVAEEQRSRQSWRALAPVRGGRRRTPVRAAVRGERIAFPIFPPDTELVFFGGKGGVGKTTCAAAAALASSRAQPHRLVRLISTDPAASLSDVLGIRVGDRWTPVPGRSRLEVRELDAPALFAASRARYAGAVHDFFDRLSGGSTFDLAADRAIFERAFDLAPPGIDEVMALLSVMDVDEGSGGGLVLVDTAPTGHTTRLLALPAVAHEWTALLMRLVIKYRLAAQAEAIARDLVRLSRGLREFRRRLSDATRARFVTVVRPGALPRLETGRLLATLRRLGVVAPTVILNAMTGGDCADCRARARAEAQEAERIRRSWGERLGRSEPAGCDIMRAPLQLPPPHGTGDLLEWAHAWKIERNGREPRRAETRRQGERARSRR